MENCPFLDDLPWFTYLTWWFSVVIYVSLPEGSLWHLWTFSGINHGPMFRWNFKKHLDICAQSHQFWRRKKGSILDNDDLIHTLNTAKATMRWCLMTWTWHRIFGHWGASWCPHSTFVFDNEVIWRFPKMGVPLVIIHLYPFLDGIFPHKLSIVGYPHLWKPPYTLIYPFWIQWARQPRSRLECPWRRLPKLPRPWSIDVFFIQLAFFGHRHGTSSEEVGWCPFFRPNKFDLIPQWEQRWIETWPFVLIRCAFHSPALAFWQTASRKSRRRVRSTSARLDKKTGRYQQSGSVC